MVMVCETFSAGDSVVHRLDPRVRVVAAIAFAVVVAMSERLPVLGAALAAAAAGVGVARLPFGATVRRLLPLEAFLLVLWVVVPLTSPGPAAWGQAGVQLAARVTVKANAIVLALTILIGTMEVSTLGHALHHLRAPAKLVHLLLFTIRYVDVIHHELARLRTAMRVRCFRAGANRHTYRTVGNLVGMLLVRSFDRAERIVAAMKCRGFRGRFYLLDHFALARRDGWFSVVACGVILALAWAEWR
ncbi:cobalt ECF transporter T component CbiQ [bacterium]|nr:cobalt ECF transporter T component CbiQ [bacterium]